MNTQFDIINQVDSEDNTSKLSIADLLSYNPNKVIHDIKQFKHILVLTYDIVVLFIDAMNKFYIKKKYHYFNPHIEKSSQQIIAYMLGLHCKEYKIEK